MWNDVTKCLKAFKIAPPALLDTLIADDDELLAAMLKYEKDQKDAQDERERAGANQAYEVDQRPHYTLCLGAAGPEVREDQG